MEQTKREKLDALKLYRTRENGLMNPLYVRAGQLPSRHWVAFLDSDGSQYGGIYSDEEFKARFEEANDPQP